MLRIYRYLDLKCVTERKMIQLMPATNSSTLCAVYHNTYHVCYCCHRQRHHDEEGFYGMANGPMCASLMAAIADDVADAVPSSFHVACCVRDAAMCANHLSPEA